MQNTISDESVITLREHGLSDCMFVDEEPATWYISIVYDGQEREQIYINEMFGYKLPADQLFEYHKRFVPDYADVVAVSVFDDEFDEIYLRSTNE